LTRGPRALERFDALPSAPLRLMAMAAGAVLVGALAFGLWHVVVGGLIDGNPRAGAFGVGLALAAGIALLVGRRMILAHESRRPPR